VLLACKDRADFSQTASSSRCGAARSPSDDAGESDWQEKLMNTIRVRVGQEKVKDLVKEESEKLRQAAEEVGVMHDMRKY